MRKRDPDAVLARLGEDRLDALIEVLLRLVDIDEGRRALVFRDGRALQSDLGQERDEEPTEEFTAFLLQQVLGRVYENDLAIVQRLEEIELVGLLGEHAFERGRREHAPEAFQDL